MQAHKRSSDAARHRLFPHHMSAAVRFHSTQQPEDRLTDWSSGCFFAISGCCLRVFDK